MDRTPIPRSRGSSRLNLAGFTAAEVADVAGLSRGHTSHALNGRVPWSLRVEAALLLVTKDRDLVAEIRTLTEPNVPIGRI